MSVLAGNRRRTTEPVVLIRSRPAPLRVAIAEDCDVIRHGLSSMLAPYSERVRLISSDRRVAVHNDPHLVLHETQRHDMNSDSAEAELDQDLRADRAVVYSWDVNAAARAWTDHRKPAGFVSKTLAAEHLVAALERIGAGDRVSLVVSDAQVPAPETWPGQHARLGQQESRVLALIVSGIGNLQIAERLRISVNTVKTYIRSTYQKIGVETRSQAMLWAIDNGFRDSVNGSHRTDGTT